MDRKGFLKSVCGLGACACAVNALQAEEAPPADRRLAFARHQFAKMLGFMAGRVPTEACAGVLEQTGRECAKLGQLPLKFKGDPDGYMATARKLWGTQFDWDKQKGVITVTVAEGECGCPLVDPKRTPALFCNCSVGYQKESFEGIFGKPVKAVLKESKLSGSKRCVFEVTLA